MVFENLHVRHKTFGLGTIISTDGKYIKVRFESGIEKNFVYPDSFERFLTLEDGTISNEIMADLSLSNERKAKIQAEKNEENIRSMTHGIVIPGKEGATENEDDEQGYKNSSYSE